MKSLILVILLAGNASAMTLSGIRDDVRTLVVDNKLGGNAARCRFTDAQLNGWINEGQAIADAKAMCVYKRIRFDLSVGTTYYPLPDGYMMIRRVTRDSLAIQELSPAALDGRSAMWETTSGLPTYYFTNFSTRSMIGFAPFPNMVVDTATISVEYIAYSPNMTLDAQVPFEGIKELSPYHPALSFYAAYKASIVDERYDKAKVFMDSYSALVDLMKTQCVNRINYLPSMIGKSQ